VDVSSSSKRFYGGHKDRCLLDGILASFGSNLNERSYLKLLKVIEDILQVPIDKYEKIVYNSRNNQLKGYINMLGFYLKEGDHKTDDQGKDTFLLTETVKKTLIGLLRVICHSEFPILLEGPTSAGKTSIIKYIAETSGNKVVRINNHQHTDLDEYIGTYSPDSTGKLVFKQGLLVEAMIKGYWLILDEINLAKSEILEALNRLLDDNRELYIPEINKLIKPHPDFRIFATQNPLTYGGRKELSAAFRSRFVHFYFRDLQANDLITIVKARCEIPESRAKTLVGVMNSLRMVRSRQNFFAGKESLITIRDLLKWGSRDVVDYERMAIEGNSILVERLRHEEEKQIVKKIIEDTCIKG
jgi:midasin